jgi:hypothetical protein
MLAILMINNCAADGCNRHHIRVAVSANKSNSSSKHSAEIIEKRTKLTCYLTRFCKLQAVYMPGALQALVECPVPMEEVEVVKASLVENVPLLLPSALSPELCAFRCNKGVEAIEMCLRDTQFAREVTVPDVQRRPSPPPRRYNLCPGADGPE